MKLAVVNFLSVFAFLAVLYIALSFLFETVTTILMILIIVVVVGVFLERIFGEEDSE